MASLTVKGGPMTGTQQNTANAILAEAKTQHASTLVMQALIFAAIMESDLGVSLGPNHGGYGGPLAGQMSYFNRFGAVSSLPVLQQQVDSFVGGGHGFNNAASLEGQFQNEPGLLAAKVEEPVVNGSLGPSGYGQYYTQNVNGLTGAALMNKVVGEAVLIVQKYGGGGITGSTSGPTSGTKSSQTAPFYVGSAANPSEDVWTAVNRLAQARYWYLFSDGETLYMADGGTIIQQEPAYTLDRWGDLDKIVRLSFTWDNTAFQYASDHRRRKKIVRKTQVAKVSSPVEAELDLICPIDAVRAGDVIKLAGCGPGDGKWLVGDCRRSVFKIYSELTLVPAVTALSEAQTAIGLSATSNADIPGPAAGAPGTGTIISALDSAASSISNNGWPFVSYGGRAQAGTPDPGHPGEPGGFYDGHTSGFDGPGAVAAVLAAAGLWTGAVPDASAIVSKLLSEKLLVRGRGSGVPEFSLFLGKFFFCFINATGTGSYWGSQDGGGPSNQAPPSIVAGRFTGGQFGGIWLNAPPSLSGYQEYHVPQNLLGDLLNNAALGTLTGTYQNPFAAAPGSSLTPSRIDMGVDYAMADGTPIHAIGDATVGSQTFSLGTGGAGWPGNGQSDGGWIDYQLTDGPYQGKQIYVAEGVVPVVAPNSTVQAGQHIATFRANGSNLETGWYGGVGTSTLAANLKQFNGSNSTAAGVSFSRLLVSLGAPGGQDNGGNTMGKPLPAGYPGAPWGK